MAKKQIKDESKPSVLERVDSGRNTVDQVISFVDWIRYVVDWIKGLFGR